MPLFTIIFDEDHGNGIFILCWLFYSCLYIWYLCLTEAKGNQKWEKILFFLNPFHWICLIGGFAIIPIFFCLRDRFIQEQRRNRCGRELGGKKFWLSLGQDFNIDLEMKVQKVLSSINNNNDNDENIIRWFDQSIRNNIKPDKVPEDTEYDNKCTSCNKDIQEHETISIDEEGEFIHVQCQTN